MLQFIVTEEERNQALEALKALDSLDASEDPEKEKGILFKKPSPGKIALEFVKEYFKALFSQETWVEARKTEYQQDLERHTAAEQQRTSYQYE